MKESVIEIVSLILDELSQNKSFKVIEKNILKSKKFKKSSVSAAFSWLFDKILANKLQINNEMNNSTSKRIFSEDELNVIGLENYKRLYSLYNLGIITNYDLNLILDHILLSQINKVSEQEINLLLLSSLFQIDRNTLPGSRMLLYLSDKIN